VKGAILLLVAGALLSLAVYRGSHPSQLLATLETEVTVHSWDAGTALARLGDELLVVDGRTGVRGARPRGAFRAPFEERSSEGFSIPEGRDVKAVLVVMEKNRASEARDLAQLLGREWGIAEVATLRGGFEAWQAAGLPVEEGGR
jgi:rhodanese-related sulfurtransferase